MGLRFLESVQLNVALFSFIAFLRKNSKKKTLNPNFELRLKIKVKFKKISSYCRSIHFLANVKPPVTLFHRWSN